MVVQVTKAAKLFKQAGCVSGDVKAALTSHIKHGEPDFPEYTEEPKKVLACSICCTTPGTCVSWESVSLGHCPFALFGVV